MTFVLDKEFWESIYWFHYNTRRLFAMGGFSSGMDGINNFLGAVATAVACAILVSIIVQYINKALKENGAAIGTLLGLLHTIIVLIPAAIYYGVPYWIERTFGGDTSTELDTAAQWLFITIAGIAMLLKRKHVESHAWRMWIITLLTFAAGWWLLGKWIGVLLFSLPMLAIYLLIAFQFSQAVIPAQNHKAQGEVRQRFLSFAAYLFGVQAPFWKSLTKDAKEADKLIDGDKSISSHIKPLVWTYPHQAAGVLKGSEFTARGPGMFFLEKGEQPFDLVDLRVRSKNAPIKAISRDGIPLEATVLVVFQVDSATYTVDTHINLRKENILLEQAPNTNLDGMFPYSRGRVKAALSLRSTRENGIGIKTVERWEEHILALAEKQARETLSGRSVEELWRARLNADGSAAEEIAQEMKRALEPELKKNGILLINAKVTNLILATDKSTDKEKEAEVVELQVAAWRMELERKQSIRRADVEVEAERTQQEARAYAHSVLMTAIAEGLQQAQAIHPNLPRYVIALRYLGTLEKLLEEQVDENEPASQQARLNLSQARKNVISKMGGE
jgi:regulator of protease activity HflC (stomatin/prohibitin superfamily)